MDYAIHRMYHYLVDSTIQPSNNWGLVCMWTITAIILSFEIVAKEGEAIDFTCELDEYAQLVKDFQASGLIKDHRKGLIHNYKNSFVGKEAVDWLVSTKKIGKYYFLHSLSLKVSKLSFYKRKRNFRKKVSQRNSEKASCRPVFS